MKRLEEKLQENDTLTPASGPSVSQDDPTIHAGRGVFRGVIVDSEHGWIKLHRKITEWEWYDDHITFKVFVHLLLTVNHKPKQWRGIEIKRGQLVISTHKLPKKLNIGRQQFRTALSRLKSTGEINLEPTRSFSVVTICNYNDYQNYPQPANPEPNPLLTHYQPTTNPLLTLTKEGKNDKKGKETTYSKNVASEKKVENIIPPAIDLVAEYCQTRSNGIDPEQFIDYYTSIGWMVGKVKMKNWQSAMRTWEKRKTNAKTADVSNPTARLAAETAHNFVGR